MHFHADNGPSLLLMEGPVVWIGKSTSHIDSSCLNQKIHSLYVTSPTFFIIDWATLQNGPFFSISAMDSRVCGSHQISILQHFNDNLSLKNLSHVSKKLNSNFELWYHIKNGWKHSYISHKGVCPQHTHTLHSKINLIYRVYQI